MKKWLLIVGGVAVSVVSAYAVAWLVHCCTGAWHTGVTLMVLLFSMCAGLAAAALGVAE